MVWRDIQVQLAYLAHLERLAATRVNDATQEEIDEKCSDVFDKALRIANVDGASERRTAEKVAGLIAALLPLEECQRRKREIAQLATSVYVDRLIEQKLRSIAPDHQDRTWICDVQRAGREYAAQVMQELLRP
jgi:hypothetical protein